MLGVSQLVASRDTCEGSTREVLWSDVELDRTDTGPVTVAGPMAGEGLLCSNQDVCETKPGRERVGGSQDLFHNPDLPKPLVAEVRSHAMGSFSHTHTHTHTCMDVHALWLSTEKRTTKVRLGAHAHASLT